jgi:hypothetical protein
VPVDELQALHAEMVPVELIEYPQQSSDSQVPVGA